MTGFSIARGETAAALFRLLRPKPDLSTGVEDLALLSQIFLYRSPPDGIPAGTFIGPGKGLCVPYFINEDDEYEELLDDSAARQYHEIYHVFQGGPVADDVWILVGLLFGLPVVIAEDCLDQ